MMIPYDTFGEFYEVDVLTNAKLCKAMQNLSEGWSCFGDVHCPLSIHWCLSQVTSTKPGPIAPYLDVQSVVEAAKPGVPFLHFLEDALEDARC